MAEDDVKRTKQDLVEQVAPGVLKVGDEIYIVRKNSGDTYVMPPNGLPQAGWPYYPQQPQQQPPQPPIVISAPEPSVIVVPAPKSAEKKVETSRVFSRM